MEAAHRTRVRQATQALPAPRAEGPAGPEPRGVAGPASAARGEHARSGEEAVPARDGDRFGADHPEADHPEAGRPGPERRVPQRYSVRDQVLGALRRALVAGELEPGAVYSAPALACRFGVSATPVREAMQQLVREGAVEAAPNKGFLVVERSAADLAELAEVRALIEVPVMLRLARTVAPARWEELRPLAEATVSVAVTGDRAAYAEADRRFHRAVLELSGNRQLVRVAEELHCRAQWPVGSGLGGPRGHRATARPGELLADAKKHSALLEALVAQDLDTVEALVREHFFGVRGTV